MDTALWLTLLEQNLVGFGGLALASAFTSGFNSYHYGLESQLCRIS